MEYFGRFRTFRNVMWVSVFMAVLATSLAKASPTSLNYQGRIVKTDGHSLEFNSVSFIFKITDPTGQCVIYQEQIDGVDMTNSDGVFDVPIGMGSVLFPTSGSLTVLDVFNNSMTFSCSGSSTYSPAVSDGRKLRVQFFDGAGWNTISPDVTIRSVPYAAYSANSAKFANHGVSDFLLKAGLPTCGAGTFLSYDGTSLICAAASAGSSGTVTNVTSANSYVSVATGTTTPVLTLNVGTTSGTVAAGNDSRFSDARTPTGSAGGDLTGTYPNPTIAASAVTTTKLFTNPGVGRLVMTDTTDGSTLSPLACSNGQLLSWTSSGWSCTDASSLTTGTPTSFSGSLSGDVTGTQSATVVAAVGGVTATNVATGVGLANGAVSTNTASTLVKRDSSGGFSAGAASASSLILRDGTTNTITMKAPTTVTTYALTLPAATGTSGQTLVTDGSGNLSWSTPSTGGGGSVTNVTATAPLSVANGTSTPALSITKATTSVDGYLSSTDWTTFNGKLTSALASAKIFVGDGTGTAAAVSMSGDVSLSNAGAAQVNKIQGVSIVGTAVTGGLMKYDAATTSWKGVAFPACTSSQTPYWNSGSDSIICQGISYSTSNFGSQTANTVLAAPDGSAGNPTFRSLASTDVKAFAYVSGGNSFGAIASLGTTDAYGLQIKTSGSTRMTFDTSGNVGVAQTLPRAALDVSGTILGKAATSNAGATIDFSSGNLQYTANSCGTFNFNNLKDGGSYMFAVQGTISATCAFNAYSDAGSTALTVHMPPDHSSTTAGKHTVYNLAVMGSHVYIAWTPGY